MDNAQFINNHTHLGSQG